MQKREVGGDERRRRAIKLAAAGRLGRYTSFEVFTAHWKSWFEVGRSGERFQEGGGGGWWSSAKRRRRGAKQLLPSVVWAVPPCIG